MPLRRTLLLRWTTYAFLSGLVLSGIACESEDKIVVQNVLEEKPNQAPLIVKQGPGLPPGGFEVVSYYEPRAVDLWVLVGDPDGLNDISLVAVDVDSVVLLRFLVRPDTSTSFCTQFSYAPNDTIPTGAILPVPAAFPGVHLRALRKSQGGLYSTEGFGSLAFGFPDIVGRSNLLEPWSGGCGGGPSVLGPIYVLPPATASRRTAIVTYVDVEYHGISVTVYDDFGASVSTSFPDWRVVYTTVEEKASAP